MKTLVALTGAVVLAATVAGCGTSEVSTPPDTVKCKQAAEDVYRDYLKAQTLSEVLEVQARLGGTERIRDALPECDNLTNKQSRELKAELESSDLFRKSEAHVAKVMVNQ